MDLDPHSWSPLSVEEVVATFASFPAPWWVAGGWALDLFLGRTTRVHEDMDILLLRRDQLLVQKHLHDWQLFKTQQPTPSRLAPWPRGEYLELPVCDIWVRQELQEGPWRFQLMLLDAEGEDWVYRRLRSIRGRIARLGLRTADGVPYLAPEVQLLYKSGTGRPKDAADFRNVLPHLPPDRIRWLLACLREQYPEEHGWAAPLVRALGCGCSDRP